MERKSGDGSGVAETLSDALDTDDPAEVKRTIEVLEARLHQGPLPTPSDTEAYERVYPGATKIMFDRWQQQSDHRMALERSTVDSNLAARTRGQYIGLTLAALVIAGGFIAIYLDKSLAGFAALVLAAAAIAGRFLVTLRRESPAPNTADPES